MSRKCGTDAGTEAGNRKQAIGWPECTGATLRARSLTKLRRAPVERGRAIVRSQGLHNRLCMLKDGPLAQVVAAAWPRQCPCCLKVPLSEQIVDNEARQPLVVPRDDALLGCRLQLCLMLHACHAAP